MNFTIGLITQELSCEWRYCFLFVITPLLRFVNVTHFKFLES